MVLSWMYVRPSDSQPARLSVTNRVGSISQWRLEGFSRNLCETFTASRRCAEPILGLTVSMSRSRYKVKCCNVTWGHIGFYVRNDINKIDEISTCSTSNHYLLLLIYFIIIVITLYSAADPVQILEEVIRHLMCFKGTLTDVS